MTLPQSWRVVPLGDLVAPTRPRHKPADYPNLPFIGMEHVEAHSMRLLGTVQARTMMSSAVHFQPGDVLYGRLRPYLNKVYRPDFEGLCSAEFIVLPSSDQVDARYLQYFLNSAPFVGFASHLNTGDRPRIDFEQLRTFPVPVPELDEQRRIVSEIEQHMSGIETGRQSVAVALVRAKQLRHRLLIDAVRGHPWGLLGDVVTAMGNGFYVSRPGTEKTSVAILRVSAVRSMHLNLDDVRFVPESLSKQALRYQLRDGDLLFTRLNGNPEFVGACAMVRNSVRPVVFSDKFIRIQVDPSKSDPEFLELALAVGMSRQAIRARCKTTAGQASIAGSDLRSVPIPVPILSKQQEIADLAHHRMTSIDRLLEELPRVDAWAQRLRTSVLSAAFTGRLAKPSAGPQTQFMSQAQLVSAAAGVHD